MDAVSKLILVRRSVATAITLSLLAATAANAASIQLKGVSPYRKAELRRAITLLAESDSGAKDSDQLSANAVEDAALLTINRLRKRGYLDTRIDAVLTSESGESRQVVWQHPYDNQTQRGEAFDNAVFDIDPGKRYYYESVVFSGLQSIPETPALARFYPPSPLIDTESRRPFSPSLLDSSLANLIGALRNLGKTNARVVERSVESDPETGATRVSIVIDEGRAHIVNRLSRIVDGETVVADQPMNEVFTRDWTARLRQQELSALRPDGHADAKVSVRVADRMESNDTVLIHIEAEIETGPRYTISRVVHSGANRTRHSLLERKAELQPGDILNASQVEESRKAISDLGVFRSIETVYANDGPNKKSVQFNYTENQLHSTQALFGYGSYERLRAGLIYRRAHLLGRAHTASIAATQSMKSSHASALYELPEIFGEPIKASLSGEWLEREERAFDRLESGVSLQLSSFLERPQIVLDIEYEFENKEARSTQVERDFLLEETRVGSLSIRASRREVDNPIYPKNGYEYGLALTHASPRLGSESQYTKIEGSLSFSRELSRNIGSRASLRYGLIASPGGGREMIPFGERFTLGGENTVRGYRHGQASPLDASGTPLGSEAYALANFEIEYKLLQKVSAVTFFDTVRFTETSEDLDQAESLHSVGIGIRYNTILGPVRLEYGRNLNPRQHDPSDSLHLSVGVPF